MAAKKAFSENNGTPDHDPKPNPPLIAAFVFMILAAIVPPLRHPFQIASTVSFVGWAVEEIHLGDSWFRRLLGVVVLGFIFMRML